MFAEVHSHCFSFLISHFFSFFLTSLLIRAVCSTVLACLYIHTNLTLWQHLLLVFKHFNHWCINFESSFCHCSYMKGHHCAAISIIVIFASGIWWYLLKPKLPFLLWIFPMSLATKQIANSSINVIFMKMCSLNFSQKIHDLLRQRHFIRPQHLSLKCKRHNYLFICKFFFTILNFCFESSFWFLCS